MAEKQLTDEAGEVVQLSDDARAQHAKDEELIQRALDTLLEVGAALLRIRDRRSYLLTHGTFGDYLEQRWELDPRYAYNMMDGAKIVALLSEASLTPPANVRVATALRPFRDSPQQLIRIWKKALEQNPKPVTREVKAIVDEARRSGKHPPREDAPELEEAELTTKQRELVNAIRKAKEALVAAVPLAAEATTNASDTQRRAWLAQIDDLKPIMTQLRAPIGKELKKVNRRGNS